MSRWTKLPYGLSLAVVVLALAGAIGLFAWLHGPDLVREVGVVYGQVNDQISTLWTRLGNVDWLQGAIDKARDYFQHIGSHAAGYAAGFVTTTLGGFGTVLLIVVAAIYIAAAPETYADGLVSLMPHPLAPARLGGVGAGGPYPSLVVSSASSPTWRRSACSSASDCCSSA